MSSNHSPGEGFEVVAPFEKVIEPPLEAILKFWSTWTKSKKFFKDCAKKFCCIGSDRLIFRFSKLFCKIPISAY